MRDFEVHRPATLAEALVLLRKGGKAMAGGQSLLPLLKLDLAEPREVVSLSGLAELDGIRREGDSLIVGAGATHDQIARSAEVRSHIPALARLAGKIGDPQVRNRGTLGGSIAHADPAADHPAALLALDATVVTDRREIGAHDFFRGVFQTALATDEIIRGVRFGIPSRAAYVKFPHPASKFAVVGVMVAQGRWGTRVAVTGAGPTPFRVPVMEEALERNFRAAALAGLSVPADDLLSDDSASNVYRAHLVGVLARRAVGACA
jgi:carbon-monoxide dehydrogenase medium subunit